MSDMTRKEAPIFSEQDAQDLVDSMDGFRAYEPQSYSLIARIRCRLFGPHDWISVMGYDVVTMEMTEEGAICERCKKETPWTNT